MIKWLFVFMVSTSLLVCGIAVAEQPPGSEEATSCEKASKKAAPLLESEDESSLREAMKIFGKVLVRRSDCVPALVGYARALNSIKGFGLEIADYYLAYEYLARALVLDPKNAQAWWVMADLQRHMGRYDRALALAKKAVEMAPQDHWAHYVLGSALIRVNLDEGIKSLEKALELKPGWVVVRVNLSAAYIQAGKFSEALKQIEAYLKAYPNNLNALTNRGVIYLKLGKLDKAEESFSKALEISPRFGMALKGMGDVHATRKDFARAIKSYKLALVSMPRDIALWVLLAETQLSAGLIEDAIAAYEEAVKLAPGSEELKKRLDELKAKRKNEKTP